MRLSLISSFLLALAGANASVNLPLIAAAAPAAEDTAAKSTPPSKDPFYNAPNDFKSKKPGAILKHRPVPKPLRVGPALETNNYKAAFQLLYRTTNGLGKASVAVQTVIVPKGGGDPTKLLSYQTFYDAAFNDCAPSYTLQTGQGNLNIEGVTISSALRQGWYVTVSDYEGTDAAFTVGRQAGHATLDGIRATLGTRSFTNIAKDPNVALFGYSGGALASEWAMELQPSYAPNLKIVGAAFGGLTPNVTSVILDVNDTPNSNLIPTGTLGFANQYKNVSKFLDQALKPAKAFRFHLPQRSCDTSKLTNLDIFFFFEAGNRVLDDPILKSTVNANGIMGKTNTPKVPLFIYKSTGDEVSPVADTDKLVQKYCKNGASIRYIRNKFGTHETEFIVQLPNAFSWLKKRLNGEKPPKPCSTRTENVSKLMPHAKKILGNTVFQELKSQLQQFKGGM